MTDHFDKLSTNSSLMHQAVDAMRQYHEARDSGVAHEEVERLRLQAEWMFQSVSEYMRKELGGPEEILQ